MSPTSKFLILLSALLAVGAVLTGCGAETEAEPLPPLAASLAIDDSVTTNLPGIETAYAEDAAVLMNSVIARGGSFTASIFRGSAAAYTVGSLEVDPQASLARRRRDSQGSAEAIGGTLGQVLGLSKMTPAVAERLETLPEGSAVADALREAVRSVQEHEGTRWAVVASDGINNTNGEELPLGNVSHAARILSEAVGDLNARKVNIAMVGIGLSQEKLGSGRAQPLVEAWEKVCHDLEAATCEIRSEPTLPAALQEGGS